MEFTHQLWIHEKDLQRFKKFTPLVLSHYNGGGKEILTAQFNLDGLLTSLKRGFVLGEVVNVGDPVDRGVLITGNTQYSDGLIISASRPNDLRGRGFAQLIGDTGADFTYRVFQTYFSDRVSRAEGFTSGFDKRFILYSTNGNRRKRI